MSTEIQKQTHSVIEVVNKEELISFLDTMGLASKLTEKEKLSFIKIAQAFGLNPFKREIYVSKYGENLSIITGYEVYIKRAERTGMLDGWSATTTGSVETKDLKAIVTIYRKDRQHPFIWEALYEECVQKTREGRVTKFWEKSSFMTKKVAISQGFRLCFSDELAGMPYTADEMPEPETHDVPHVEVKEPVAEIKKPSLPKSGAKFESAAEYIKGYDGSVFDALDVIKKKYEVSEELEALLGKRVAELNEEVKDV